MVYINYIQSWLSAAFYLRVTLLGKTRERDQSRTNVTLLEACI
jgi:hypothetical protein